METGEGKKKSEIWAVRRRGVPAEEGSGAGRSDVGRSRGGSKPQQPQQQHPQQTPTTSNQQQAPTTNPTTNTNTTQKRIGPKMDWPNLDWPKSATTVATSWWSTNWTEKGCELAAALCAYEKLRLALRLILDGRRVSGQMLERVIGHVSGMSLCKSSNGLITASLRSNGPAASLNSSTSWVLRHFWKVSGVSRGQARSWPLMRVRTEKGSPQRSLLPHRFLLGTPVIAPPLQLPVSCTRAQTRARGFGPIDRN